MSRASDIYRRSRASSFTPSSFSTSSSSDRSEVNLAEESPAERFSRLFDPRLLNVRRAIRAVANLGGARYECNEHAVQQIARAIREEAEMAIHALERNVQKSQARKSVSNRVR